MSNDYMLIQNIYLSFLSDRFISMLKTPSIFDIMNSIIISFCFWVEWKFV